MSDPLSSPLDRASILAHLGPDADKVDLDVLHTCESTNTALLASPAQPGRLAVLATEIQTAGRGRRGRSWHAFAGGSLIFSVRWARGPQAASPAGLSLAAGVAIAEVLESFGCAGLALKWPNDILIDQRKAGGILVEITGSPAAQSVVIGVGLNTQLPARAVDDIVMADVFSAMQKPPTRDLLLARLIAALHAMLPRFDQHGFAVFEAAWSARHAHAGKRVTLQGEGAMREGRVIGVDHEGALWLDTPQGKARVLSGDVSLREIA
ncbi:MAG: hypothetical protein RIR70_1281 [Pseudomonadota bacterium]|jgi:BirA family biotin operon repressor/biotin-[acetyl-CoA-carboxylase] ligase